MISKEEFMYITGADENQIESAMLLGNETIPEDEDWTEVLKHWYDDICSYANNVEKRYLDAISNK